jgi:Caudovirus prohead serine protease
MVKRGDVSGASFRFVVGDETWEGERRTVTESAELIDLSLATTPAYEGPRVELRSRPETTTVAVPQQKEPDMSEAKTEERTEAPEEKSEETREAPQEPAGSLRVEDRAGGAGGRRLVDEFRSRGFPGETATISWGEYRAAMFSGSIEDLAPVRRDGVPLGSDMRYAFPAFPQVAVDASTTSVQVSGRAHAPCPRPPR